MCFCIFFLFFWNDLSINSHFPLEMWTMWAGRKRENQEQNEARWRGRRRQKAERKQNNSMFCSGVFWALYAWYVLDLPEQTLCSTSNAVVCTRVYNDTAKRLQHWLRRGEIQDDSKQFAAVFETILCEQRWKVDSQK